MNPFKMAWNAAKWLGSRVIGIPVGLVGCAVTGGVKAIGKWIGGLAQIGGDEGGLEGLVIGAGLGILSSPFALIYAGAAAIGSGVYGAIKGAAGGIAGALEGVKEVNNFINWGPNEPANAANQPVVPVQPSVTNQSPITTVPSAPAPDDSTKIINHVMQQNREVSSVFIPMPADENPLTKGGVQPQSVPPGLMVQNLDEETPKVANQAAQSSQSAKGLNPNPERVPPDRKEGEPEEPRTNRFR